MGRVIFVGQIWIRIREAQREIIVIQVEKDWKSWDHTHPHPGMNLEPCKDGPRGSSLIINKSLRSLHIQVINRFDPGFWQGPNVGSRRKTLYPESFLPM